MSLEQVLQHKHAAVGFGRVRAKKEMGTRMESRSQSNTSNPSGLSNSGVVTGSNNGRYGSRSSDRLLYLTTCLIGHHVEVQVKDGSLISGIFHATNAEKDFGIILKSACSTRFRPSQSHPVSKAHFKTLIIAAKDLVQIIAKDVPLNGLPNESQAGKPQDILLDSFISQSPHVDVERKLVRWIPYTDVEEKVQCWDSYIDVERKLERWVPDGDDPQRPDLENIFDGRRNRGWDQFEVNETLFGVKSTFSEDLYTTKLERGPQMRDIEREASRIAREIEGEETQDLHLAEERGIDLPESFDIDEETKYSSVFRGVDDSGYDEDEDILLDSYNSETFGAVPGSVGTSSLTVLSSERSSDGAEVLTTSSFMDEVQTSQGGTGRDFSLSDWDIHASQLSTESVLESGSRAQVNQLCEHDAENNYLNKYEGKQTLGDEAQMVKSDGESVTVLADSNKHGSDKGGLSPNATSFDPSPQAPHKGQDKRISHADDSEGAAVVKSRVVSQSVNICGRPSTATSSTSDCGPEPGPGPASASVAPPRLSTSSSTSSLSSEKSTLNPHAKEFKFNANAKSFLPSQRYVVRPASPVFDGAFHFPPSGAGAPPMHGMPMGVGAGPYAGQQQVMFNPQTPQMQSPQPYFHPNRPQYGQHMMLGHPHNVMYLQSYPPEMPYQGRDY